MTDLVVVVPTLSRPQAAWELAETFRATTTADTALCFAVNEGDQTEGEYRRVLAERSVTIEVGGRSMVEALNLRAVAYADGDDPPFALGFMGDDHRPRTRGWDARYLDALRELGTGIVYGDDLLQGENLPTQVAMTSDVVRALGHMCPPSLTHMYADNYWRDLGRAAKCLRYLPDVVVEHMHPVAGKGTWDAGYLRVNHQSVYDRDLAAYRHHIDSGRFAADVAKIRGGR